METYDPISRAKINLVDVGGKTLPFLLPVTAWAIGGLVVFPTALWILTAVLGMSLVTVFLAAGAASAAGRWVGRETGGDHRLQDIAATAAAELRSTHRRWKARR